ncbi:hypothetical protein ANN_03175 [Periplaneta americana]|uniref:Endonuclease-reverse transcriptase n=1 Tax=Periplaneta americana TaxID=6978 RepID=A0ABQ8TYF8_PERAM|nr:hypothetical protein ANN_03175 [Periplaneta americana]
MAGLREGCIEPPGSLKPISKLWVEFLDSKRLPWSLTKKQALKLGRCQRRMERKILGISLKDRIRNEEVRRRSGVEDVVTLAKRMKWRWGGRVIRKQPTRWAHTATLWDPRIGWRNRGRPRTRWDDEFKLQLGGLWTRIGRQRTRWKDAVNQL